MKKGGEASSPVKKRGGVCWLLSDVGGLIRQDFKAEGCGGWRIKTGGEKVLLNSLHASNIFRLLKGDLSQAKRKGIETKPNSPTEKGRRLLLVRGKKYLSRRRGEFIFRWW